MSLSDFVVAVTVVGGGALALEHSIQGIVHVLFHTDLDGPRDQVLDLDGIQLTVREEALTWNGHKIRMTVQSSPESKLNAFFVQRHMWTEDGAHTECVEALRKAVRAAYGAAPSVGERHSAGAAIRLAEVHRLPRRSPVACQRGGS